MTDKHEGPERRTYDRAIANLASRQSHLHECMEAVKSDMLSVKGGLAANTEITTQIRDALVWCKVTLQVVTWVGGIAGGVYGILQLASFLLFK